MVALTAIYLLLLLNALVFAVRRRVRSAIFTLGAVVLLYNLPFAFVWASVLPSVFSYIDVLLLLGPPVLFSLLAAIAIALATRNQQLGLAAALVCLSTALQKLATLLVLIWGAIVFASAYASCCLH
jgi:hypothetical protein